MGIEKIKQSVNPPEGNPESESNEMFSLEKFREIFDKNPFIKQTILAIGVLTSSFGNTAKAETNAQMQQIDSNTFYEQASNQESSDLTKIIQEFHQAQEQLEKEDVIASWSGYRLSLNKHNNEENLKVYEVSPDNFPVQGSGVIEMSSILGASKEATVNETSLFSGMYQHYRIVEGDGFTIEPTGKPIIITFEQTEGSYDNRGVLDFIDEELSELGVNIETNTKVSDQKSTLDEQEIKSEFGDIVESHHSTPLASWSVSTQNIEDGVTSYTIELQPGTIVYPAEATK